MIENTSPLPLNEIQIYSIDVICVFCAAISVVFQQTLVLNKFVLFITRKYPLRGYILGSRAPGTPGVTPTTYGTTFISDIL